MLGQVSRQGRIGRYPCTGRYISAIWNAIFRKDILLKRRSKRRQLQSSGCPSPFSEGGFPRYRASKIRYSSLTRVWNYSIIDVSVALGPFIVQMTRRKTSGSGSDVWKVAEGALALKRPVAKGVRMEHG